MLLAACSRAPDEERIRTALASMQQAAEAREPAGVLDRVAKDFTGNRGDVDRDGLSQMLRLQLLRREAIGVTMGAVDIAVDGDRATATFDVNLRDRTGRWVPVGGETYHVVSGWRREDGEWRCYNANWTDSGKD